MRDYSNFLLTYFKFRCISHNSFFLFSSKISPFSSLNSKTPNNKKSIIRKSIQVKKKYSTNPTSNVLSYFSLPLRCSSFRLIRKKLRNVISGGRNSTQRLLLRPPKIKHHSLFWRGLVAGLQLKLTATVAPCNTSAIQRTFLEELTEGPSSIPFLAFTNWQMLSTLLSRDTFSTSTRRLCRRTLCSLEYVNFALCYLDFLHFRALKTNPQNKLTSTCRKYSPKTSP